MSDSKDESFLKREIEPENGGENSIEIKNGSFLWERKKRSYLLAKRNRDTLKIWRNKFINKKVFTEREIAFEEQEK